MQNDLPKENVKLNWRWFIAADCRGNWIITKGAAFIDAPNDNELIQGFLCFDDEYTPGTEVYATLSGRVEEGGNASITIQSTAKGVPSFCVSGSIYELKNEDMSAQTFVLTDGGTILGLTRHYL